MIWEKTEIKMKLSSASVSLPLKCELGKATLKSFPVLTFLPMEDLNKVQVRPVEQLKLGSWCWPPSCTY